MYYLTKGSQLPPFMAYPRFLLELDISETAKLVYVLLLSRAMVSVQNEGWEDERGYVFLYFPIAGLAQALKKSEMTVKNALAVLETQGLIQRKQQGLGRANKIFVKVPQTGSCPPEGKKMDRKRDRKLSANDKKNIYNKYNKIYTDEEEDSL